MRNRILWLTFWVTVTLWFGQGCDSMNATNQPRQASPLPALRPEQPPASFSDNPSVSGIDRSGWGVHEVRVTRSDVELRPHFVRSFVLGQEHRFRESGRYPTAQEVLDLSQSGDAQAAQYLEIVVDPVVQLGNLAMAPFRAIFITPPRQIGHGPKGAYEARPATDPLDLSATTPQP